MPTISSNLFSCVNNGTSFTTGSLNVTTGDAVWVGIFQPFTNSRITNVTDNVGNTYSRKAITATTPLASIGIEIWVADNVIGSASLQVNVSLQNSGYCAIEVLDISGVTLTSFDKSGTVISGTSYITATSESSSLAPSSGSNLLLLFSVYTLVAASALDIIDTSIIGVVVGETLVDSQLSETNNNTAVIIIAVSSQPASGTGTQSMSSSLTFTGTGISGTGFAVLAASVA